MQLSNETKTSLCDIIDSLGLPILQFYRPNYIYFAAREA